MPSLFKTNHGFAGTKLSYFGVAVGTALSFASVITSQLRGPVEITVTLAGIAPWNIAPNFITMGNPLSRFLQINSPNLGEQSLAAKRAQDRFAS